MTWVVITAVVVLVVSIVAVLRWATSDDYRGVRRRPRRMPAAHTARGRVYMSRRTRPGVGA